ncbi:uncharacterized protein LOC105188508 [Harpegnathos saltator]|uniref:uncharacterized protein LOC105188508 n=1 Tax=Harpegnathos saltator TaxID=610380 RepID=UPI00058F71F5|nr:uncharacterized protein LOC105188508 [Harpegnathos saltator]XP_011148324.1 uncharacterized protein LOC105188508 [Harpegnathos saltator]
MEKKYPRGSSGRQDRHKKRKFQGNQFTFEHETSFTSTAAQKLKVNNNEDIQINPNHGYRILEFYTVFSALSQLVICKKCKGQVNFSESGTHALGFKIRISCTCGMQYVSSCPLVDRAYEINRRIVLIMRLLGIGREGLNLFCGLMDMGQGIYISTYYATLKNIHTAALAMFNIFSKKAVNEEKEQNVENGKPADELTVSGNGSWKKQGFSSLFGISTLIGKYTGKVIDFVVKSSYCQACAFWKNKEGTEDYKIWAENHQDICDVNNFDSAGKMKVDSMKEMFLKSEEKFGVKYTTYISDGDSKTFKALLDFNPYEEKPIKKCECIGHVQKRMGSCLRNKKKVEKLGGKRRLTNSLITDLTVNYGLAIRRNSHSVEEMKKAIWATFYHKCSTDKKPQHMYCPPGPDSWCEWRRAEAVNNLAEFHHDPPLHKDVQRAIKSIYKDLSSLDLLEQCLGGNIRNNNESFNATICRLAPKHLHSGSKVIESCAYLAAGMFNEGYITILKVMETMGVIIGQQCKLFVDYADKQRHTHTEIKSANTAKKARMASQSNIKKLHDFYEESEGLFYGPGIAD